MNYTDALELVKDGKFIANTQWEPAKLERWGAGPAKIGRHPTDNTPGSDFAMLPVFDNSDDKTPLGEIQLLARFDGTDYIAIWTPDGPSDLESEGWEEVVD